jgi:hypothetical protein
MGAARAWAEPKIRVHAVADRHSMSGFGSRTRVRPVAALGSARRKI